MTAQIIDGEKIAEEIITKIKLEVSTLSKKPCLAVVLIGNNPASKVYVNRKEIQCENIGITSRKFLLDENISTEQLISLVQELNLDPEIHGILVQLPLPEQIDEMRVIESIDPRKDVDGFHPLNAGRLFLKQPQLEPCTPAGIMEMIQSTGYPIEGKTAVVVGRSKVVGNPIAQMLLKANATVVICHKKTKNLEYYTKQADILVVAAGVPKLITKDMVKEGALVIDVGTNRVDDPSKKKGYFLCGDVDFSEVKDKSLYISPVPGGVGPVTVAMLMKNTLKAYHFLNHEK